LRRSAEGEEERMARRGGRRVRRGEGHWKDVLRRFEGSGQSITAFCRQEGVPLSSFQRWRRRLGGEAVPKFVEILPAKAAQVPASSWALELALPNGAVLRFRG
jgi:hypothetical protein